LGGAFFVTGMYIMAYNVYKTIKMAKSVDQAGVNNIASKMAKA